MKIDFILFITLYKGALPVISPILYLFTDNWLLFHFLIFYTLVYSVSLFLIYMCTMLYHSLSIAYCLLSSLSLIHRPDLLAVIQPARPDLGSLGPLGVRRVLLNPP